MKERRFRTALLLFVVGCLASACSKPPPVFGVLPDFSLTDQESRSVQKKDLQGMVWVADFIYTSCGSACPMLTQRMGELRSQLGDDTSVRMVSFTVDPENDTPERLKDYADRFHADPQDWLFLTGASEEVRKTVVEGFKLSLGKETGSTDVFHSNKFVLMDQSSRIRGYFEADPGGLKEILRAVSQLKNPVGSTLAALNACLNGLSGILLALGLRAILKGKKEVHRRFMVTAFCVSVVFLISYLTRFYLTGVHRFPREGLIKTIYLSILISHTSLAAVTPVLAIRTLYLAAKERFDAHRKIARITFPIWMYVSVTGVIVYFMLYHL